LSERVEGEDATDLRRDRLAFAAGIRTSGMARSRYSDMSYLLDSFDVRFSK
jgi:hypothetical protein